MKRFFAFLLVTVVCLSLFTPAFAADQTRVFDQAGLLTSAEKREVESRISQFQQATGMDFVVVTSSEAHDSASQQQVADLFYERGGFGLDGEKSGILYYIDMYERYHYLSCTGAMQDYMPDKRVQEAIDSVGSQLSKSNYLQACLSMIDTIEKYVKAGVPEGQYRYDVVTGQQLTARHKALTTTELLICAAVALVVALVFSAAVSSSYKLKGSTYDYAWRDNLNLKMTGREDTYLRTTTTRTRKADPPQGNGSRGGGGGGFGGGMGTGVHTSSSGTSHSGGGGHF